MKTFTLYGLNKPGEECRYIGITCQKLQARFTHHLQKTSRGDYRTRWLSKMRREGIRPEMVPLCVGLTKEGASELEVAVIAELRKLGFNLVNTSPGGSAPMLGIRHTAASRKKMSKNRRGIPVSEEARINMSLAQQGKHDGELNHFFGKKHSEESLEKMSLAKKGKMVGADNPFFGKTHTPQTCQRISESRQGERHPMFGKKHSLETLEKMRRPRGKQKNPCKRRTL